MPAFLLNRKKSVNTLNVYNFLGAWQLFPEKGTYENGARPKSGVCLISNNDDAVTIGIHTSWVSLENQPFTFNYEVVADGAIHSFPETVIADEVKVVSISSIRFETIFYKGNKVSLQVVHELLPNGYLKITQNGYTDEQQVFTNTEVYHRQMSVLPYASSASGAVIKPTEEGMIKHKALSAMEEQTNMQMEQIRRQIELLALQANEIQKRRELSMKIYSAKMSFVPVIGSVYFLYETNDNTHVMSLVGPKQWGNGPYKNFVAQVKLLADHTWVEA